MVESKLFSDTVVCHMFMVQCIYKHPCDSVQRWSVRRSGCFTVTALFIMNLQYFKAS